MPELTQEQRLTKKLFDSMSMTDLPAMSAHVQQLIHLTSSSRTTANELTEAILKDYSLTNKILQVANSAYYARGTSVTSISRAVTILGFDLVKQLAMSIALFEELIQSTAMKARLVNILTQSFISAMQAWLHSREKKLHVKSDEAFLGGLLYNLGEVVVLIYLPELYLKIMEKVESGMLTSSAAKETLNGLSYLEIGRAIVHYWNFSPVIAKTMLPAAVVPKNDNDSNANLINLVIFSNRLSADICAGEDPTPVLQDFCVPLKTDTKHSLCLFEKSLESSLQSSEIVRKGEIKMKVFDRLKKLKKKHNLSS